jgi:hypothetical protein
MTKVIHELSGNYRSEILHETFQRSLLDRTITASFDFHLATFKSLPTTDYLIEHPKTKRQKRIDTGHFLVNETGSDKQLGVLGDLILRYLPRDPGNQL